MVYSRPLWNPETIKNYKRFRYYFKWCSKYPKVLSSCNEWDKEALLTLCCASDSLGAISTPASDSGGLRLGLGWCLPNKLPVCGGCSSFGLHSEQQGDKASFQWCPPKVNNPDPYLLRLLTAMQTARIKARAKRDARMISHSGVNESQDNVWTSGKIFVKWKTFLQKLPDPKTISSMARGSDWKDQPTCRWEQFYCRRLSSRPLVLTFYHQAGFSSPSCRNLFSLRYRVTC